MANLIIIKNNYMNKNALSNVVNYVRRYSKTGGQVGAQGVMLHNPEECMRKVQEYFCKTEGKHVQHFILSFDIKENIALMDLMALGYAVCALFPEYQLIFGIHEDIVIKQLPHNTDCVVITRCVHIGMLGILLNIPIN